MAASPTAWPPVGRHGGSIRSQGPHNPGQERDGLKTQSIHLDAHKGLLLGPAAGACCWGLLLGPAAGGIWPKADGFGDCRVLSTDGGAAWWRLPAIPATPLV